MDLQNVQNQNMRLVLSTDAKPRLKWTPELHQRFTEAINQLGGAESEYNTHFNTFTIFIYYTLYYILASVIIIHSMTCGRGNS